MISLRRQLTKELLAALALLLGAGLVAIAAVVWMELVKTFDAALESRALAVSALIDQENGKVEVDFSDRIMRGFAAGRARYYFELRDAVGALIARSPSLRQSELPRHPANPAGKTSYWNFTLPNGRPGRAVTFTFTPKTGADVPAPSAALCQLTVAIDREDFDETLWGLFAAMAGCGGLLFAGVFFAVPRVLRHGLAPLDQLGEQTADIDAGSLSARFAADRMPAELRPICERLNDLLARLESSFERERRFSADLAHELRTPLAELRSLAECSLKWPESRDAGADRDTLAIALQMETLVTRLLTLVRGERGQLAVQSEPVELAAFVAAAWRPFAVRAEARGVRVNFAVAPATVPADPALLRSILNNLFDNAVDYTPAGSEIVVTGDAVGTLQVANAAGALTADDAARLFDRFWRKEAARSGGEHVGLGLNLARAFAAAMGWRLGASLEDGQLVFRLTPGAR